MLQRPLAGAPGRLSPQHQVVCLSYGCDSLGVGLLDTYAGGFAVFETYGYALVFIGLVPTTKQKEKEKEKRKKEKKKKKKKRKKEKEKKAPCSRRTGKIEKGE
jgi:flagellar biosynthesis component FlhA